MQILNARGGGVVVFKRSTWVNFEEPRQVSEDEEVLKSHLGSVILLPVINLVIMAKSVFLSEPSFFF